SSYLTIRFTLFLCFFFFNDPTTSDIYTLSLHDALPIWTEFIIESARKVAIDVILDQRLFVLDPKRYDAYLDALDNPPPPGDCRADRKSTRLNSSHRTISYAVFCLKKKKN